MDTNILRTVVEKAASLGHVFVVTADQNGVPHLAAAKEITMGSDEFVEVAEWFCPGTIGNLQENHNISLVTWDPLTDTGYQLIGKLEKIEELAVLDGYAPEIEEKDPLPQIERKLVIRVDKIFDFRHAPHSDLEAT